MDLYEALKNGTEPDELERIFQEELKAAMKRYYNEEDLKDAREDLADNLIDYWSLLLGKDVKNEISTKDIIGFLESLEKDAKISYDAIKRLKNSPKKTFSLNKSSTDEEIINAFLKSLK